MTRVRGLLSTIEAEVSVNLKKELDSVEELKNFITESYKSLKKDYQPWKLSMLRNLEDEARKKVEKDVDVSKQALAQRIRDVLGSEGPTLWFDELYEKERD